jgi:hypothetical protein
MFITAFIRRRIEGRAVFPIPMSRVRTPRLARRPGSDRGLAVRRRALPVVMTTGLLASASLFNPAPASAHDAAWGQPGVHAPAYVVCHGPLPQKITLIPQIGTQLGKEWGQYVSLRYSIQNAATGAWVVNEPWSRSQWIYTKWRIIDSLGRDAGVGQQQFGTLGERSYSLPKGRYIVWVSYQWHDGQRWSAFDQSRTVSYTNMRYYHTTQASQCVID